MVLHGGMDVGQNSYSRSVDPGNYSVKIYNRNGRLVKDTTVRVYAGRPAVVRISGAS